MSALKKLDGEPVNARKYGLRPDAAPEKNQRALHQALNDAMLSGVELRIPAGAYKSSGKLQSVVQAPVRIVGDAGLTKLTFATPDGGISLTGLAPYTWGVAQANTVHIEGLTIESGVDVVSPGICIEYAQRVPNAQRMVTIRDVTITTDVRDAGSFTAGIRLKSVFQGYLENVIVVGGASCLKAGRGLDIYECIVVRCKDLDVYAYDCAVYMDHALCQNEGHAFTGCTLYVVNKGIRSSKAVGLTIEGGTHVALANSGDRATCAIDLTDVDQSFIRGCLLYTDNGSSAPGQDGIRIGGGGNSLSITDNHVFASGSGQSRYGVNLSGYHAHATISGNTVAGFKEAGVIVADPTCTHTRVYDNPMYGNARDVIDRGTNSRVRL